MPKFIGTRRALFGDGGVPNPTITDGSIDSNFWTNATANIIWTTANGATSQVDWGTTAGYGNTTTLDPALVTSHLQTIGDATTPLITGTTYHYRVRSKNVLGVETVSSDQTFVFSPELLNVGPFAPNTRRYLADQTSLDVLSDALVSGSTLLDPYKKRVLLLRPASLLRSSENIGLDTEPMNIHTDIFKALEYVNISAAGRDGTPADPTDTQEITQIEITGNPVSFSDAAPNNWFTLSIGSELTDIWFNLNGGDTYGGTNPNTLEVPITDTDTTDSIAEALADALGPDASLSTNVVTYYNPVYGPVTPADNPNSLGVVLNITQSGSVTPADGQDGQDGQHIKIVCREFAIHPDVCGPSLTIDTRGGSGGAGYAGGSDGTPGANGSCTIYTMKNSGFEPGFLGGPGTIYKINTDGTTTLMNFTDVWDNTVYPEPIVLAPAAFFSALTPALVSGLSDSSFSDGGLHSFTPTRATPFKPKNLTITAGSVLVPDLNSTCNIWTWGHKLIVNNALIESNGEPGENGAFDGCPITGGAGGRGRAGGGGGSIGDDPGALPGGMGGDQANPGQDGSSNGSFNPCGFNYGGAGGISMGASSDGGWNFGDAAGGEGGGYLGYCGCPMGPGAGGGGGGSGGAIPLVFNYILASGSGVSFHAYGGAAGSNEGCDSNQGQGGSTGWASIHTRRITRGDLVFVNNVADQAGVYELIGPPIAGHMFSILHQDSGCPGGLDAGTDWNHWNH